MDYTETRPIQFEESFLRIMEKMFTLPKRTAIESSFPTAVHMFQISGMKRFQFSVFSASLFIFCYLPL